MKHQVIINNASKDSTVLSALLKVVCKEFDRIDVIFPRKFDAGKIYSHVGNNVYFYYPQALNYIRAIMKFIMEIFSASSIQDFKKANQCKKINFDYFKTYSKALFLASLLYETAKEVLPEQPRNVKILSTWYTHSAIAVAMLKYRYPQITTASYSHSFEVDSLRNNYVALVRDSYKEKYLDAVYFISDVVMNKYCYEYGFFLNHTNKYHVMHFGSEKRSEGMCPSSTDDKFRILTCSGISDVKRLNTLAQALSLYQGTRIIEWTIIGDGTAAEKLRQSVGFIDKRFVSVKMLGFIPNNEVHEYYIKNAVDLFVNVSSSEGLPVSIMEAMSYGIPALATDVGGNREIVSSSTGYLIDANISPDTLCADISTIVEAPEKCIAKRKAAYEVWHSQYRIEDNVKLLIQEMNNLSEQGDAE